MSSDSRIEKRYNLQKVPKLFILSILFLLTSILFTGCGIPEERKKVEFHSNVSGDPVLYHPDIVEDIKNKAMNVKGVKDSTAVVIDKDISTALKVTGFDRLRLRSIRNQLAEEVLENYEGYRIHVTTDKKIFHQIRQIETQQGEQEAIITPEIEAKIRVINHQIDKL
ncbi:YhcN/YlaJ family sporulation lipoprotein [Heliorestis convoluta]|uniref:Sporulation lipoprotein YhcN/YlaJ-like protein n=1 Tax=Heliorestis convoluta TaxID=356322 RepID=A0A5Q2MWX6_9FIRM|nr:YhcN/YlaJ family sporulation lipoprotein [Heliorestis convoluta]QGG46231.1 Sporulation lipoprotein YhcN/YlaJ-like protein [Heliorestis convoluta]